MHIMYIKETNGNNSENTNGLRKSETQTNLQMQTSASREEPPPSNNLQPRTTPMLQ